jgi:hypothetical protein
VQQPGTLQPTGVAQVEVELAGQRVALEAQPAGGGGEVGGQRRQRGVVRDRAHPLPHDEAAGDEVELHHVTPAQDREGRLGDLGQPGRHPVAQRGQGVGETHGLDHVRGGDGKVLGTQHAGHRREPARGDVLLGGEEVVVPAG